jgi:hypothetical protein
MLSEIVAPNEVGLETKILTIDIENNQNLGKEIRKPS